MRDCKIRNITVVDKQDRKAVLVAISQSQVIPKSGRRILRISKKYQRLKEELERMGGQGISSTSGDIRSQGCNPQAWRVAPTNPKNNT